MRDDMLRRMPNGLIVVVLAVGCGPRLGPEPKAAETPLADTPVAKMTVHLDAAKVDAERKYTQSGQFTVDGLFYKDGQPAAATVKVTVHDENGKVARGYTLDVAELAGANANVEMWDDGFLLVAIPKPPAAPTPAFETSNPNVKAVTVEVPGGQGQTRACYYGKEILDGLRFALCELQSSTPVLGFVDVEPGAPASAPPLQ